MKASLKFRDEQKKPLVRAKVPLNILGFPFQSGVAAGESKELSLQLGTSFESGPSLKIAYKPNDTWNPFTLVLKTGTGPYGSPNSSSMTMTAEFNLVGGNRGKPSFFIHFKPRLGDFSLKKTQSSVLSNKLISQTNGAVLDNDGVNGHIDRPVINMEYLGGKSNVTVLPSVLDGLFSGVQMSARTSLPVRDQAVVRCRWGVRFPDTLIGEEQDFGKKRFHRIPLLVMDKISIEHVDGGDSKGSSNKNLKLSSEAKGVDVADMLYGVRRQLDILQGENGLLRKAVEDLKSLSSYPGGENDRGCSRVDRQGEKKAHEFSGKGGVQGDVAEELKKAMKV